MGRRAHKDEHAHSRFRPYPTSKIPPLVAQVRDKLFDLNALLKAFAAEASSFSANSSAESLPRLFLSWAGECMTEKHLVFADDSCTQVEVDDELALAIFEVIFLGRTRSAEIHRDVPVKALFESVATMTSVSNE